MMLNLHFIDEINELIFAVSVWLTLEANNALNGGATKVDVLHDTTSNLLVQRQNKVYRVVYRVF